MTTSERVRELDRLYLDWDRKYWAWSDAKKKNKPEAERAKEEAWDRYVKLRDSKEGIED